MRTRRRNAQIFTVFGGVRSSGVCHESQPVEPLFGSQVVKHVAPRQGNDYVVAVGPSRRHAWVAGESPCCGLRVRRDCFLSTGLRSIPRPCLRCGSEPSWMFVRILCEAFRGPLLAFGPCCYRACVVVQRPLGCSLGFRENLSGASASFRPIPPACLGRGSEASRMFVGIS